MAGLSSPPQGLRYTNAGTLVPDGPGGPVLFHGDERLQVEHPVTEMVTGIDIVKGRFASRRGRLSFRQNDVTFTGHSIECRINAEDPETFVPSPGLIHVFSVPGGPGVRLETFAHSDCLISPHYDSMIAKIIVHGRDRHEAIARMKRTLEMTVIEGIRTSIPLHLRVLSDPDFIAGRISTSFMERFLARPRPARLAEAV
jgi:acetyl-CoA carboxylase biotin carboxylase subunit